MSVKLSTEAQDIESPLTKVVREYFSMSPFLIAGVNRKANIGNYETLDVYSAIGVPFWNIPDLSLLDGDLLEEAASEVADRAFKIVSNETYKRYAIIRNIKTEDDDA